MEPSPCLLPPDGGASGATDLSDTTRWQETETWYRALFDATSDAVFINDLAGVVVEANPAACRMHGYTRAELIGLRRTAYIHPDYHHLLPEYVRAMTAGRTFQARCLHVRKDGTAFAVEVHATPFLYRGQPHLLGVVHDVSAQVQMQQALERRVEERTRELSTLLDVAHSVAATLELQPLLALILDQLKAVVDYAASAVYTLEGERTLRLLDYQGPLPREEICREWDLGAIAHSRAVIQGAEPVIIPDVRAQTPLARSFRETALRQLGYVPADIASWMGVPLVLRGRVLGMLAFDHGQTAYYTPQHARLALAVANHAAVAIENARLYARAQEMAAVEERGRLARELHDSVTQTLFSMTLHGRAVQVALERTGVAPDAAVSRGVRRLNELTQGALAEMRALIFELRPGALAEEGLAAALRKQAALLGARDGLNVEVDVPDERLPLEGTVEEHLYRLAQEALHNVVKHAGASRATIRLVPAVDGAPLLLEIGDDGVGFDTAASRPGHLGLGTMAERARLIGGHWEVSSAPGRGSTVRVVVPADGDSTLRAVPAWAASPGTAAPAAENERSSL